MKIKIKELRNEFGLSQNELAEKLNISQKCISNWENGVNEPDFETLIKLSRLFDVTSDYLLGIDGNQSDSSILTPLDRTLLTLIKDLPIEKKKALIELLKNI